MVRSGTATPQPYSPGGPSRASNRQHLLSAASRGTLRAEARNASQGGRGAARRPPPARSSLELEGHGRRRETASQDRITRGQFGTARRARAVPPLPYRASVRATCGRGAAATRRPLRAPAEGPRAAYLGDTTGDRSARFVRLRPPARRPRRRGTDGGALRQSPRTVTRRGSTCCWIGETNWGY